MPIPNNTFTLSSLLAGANAVRFTPNAPGDFVSLGLGAPIAPWLGATTDMNGDGRADLIFGAATDDDKFIDAGRVFVELAALVGGTTVGMGDSLTQIIIDGVNAGDQAGAAVGGIEDLNGDGRGEILIGAPGMDVGAEADAGVGFVVFGKASGGVDLNDLFTANGGGYAIKGQFDGDAAGTTLLSVASMGGDAKMDVIIGAPGNDNAGTDSGAVYVVWGKSTTSAVSLTAVAAGTGGFIITGAHNNDAVGSVVSTAADMNGDGKSEIVIGVPNGADGVLHSGKVYVVFGKSTGTAVDLATIDAGAGGGFVITGLVDDKVGDAVTGIGDVNGDGLGDILIGAPKGDHAYVVFGKAGTTGVNLADVKAGVGGFEIVAESLGDLDQLSVTGGKDLNHDGIADFVIGAPTNAEGGADAGAVYVIWGGGSGTVDLGMIAQSMGGAKIIGTAGSLTGSSVVLTGDLNADGTSDLLIGAPGAGEAAYAVYTPASWLPDHNVYGTEGADLITAGYTGFVAGGGNDLPEAQIEALMQLALRSTSEVGFQSNSARIVVLFTDASFHTAADGLAAGILTPNNGNAIIDDGGILENYPELAQVKAALDAANIIPIFAVTAGLEATYQGLSTTLGRGTVVTLSANSANIVSAITTGLTTATTTHIAVAIGGAGDDTLIGNVSDNELSGNSGSDHLRGGHGDDRLHGGDGDDTAEYSGALSDYTVVHNVDGTYTVTDGRALGDGSDTLDGVEFLGIGGATIAIAAFGTGGPVPLADTLTGIVEATPLDPGNAAGAGNVLTNDFSFTPGLVVTGITAGAAGTFTDVAAPTVISGIYGDLTIQPDGTYSYALDNTRPATEALNAGDAVSDVFSYRLADGSGATGSALITVAIAGATDLPPTVVTTAADKLLVTLGQASSLDAAVLLGNDSVNNAEGLTVTSIANATGGTVDLVAGKLVITATGAGGFDYTATSTTGATATAHVDFATVTTSLTANKVTVGAVYTAGDVVGLDGNDNLIGGAGNDRLDGGNGTDKLDGGLGADVMIGGAGADTYIVDNAGDVVVELAGGGIDTVTTRLLAYTLAADADKLLTSGAGDFTLTGNAIANTITGSAGNDHLFGLAGKDILNGGIGNDWIVGGAAADTLTGGVGADSFVFDTLGLSADKDVIKDFVSGTDQIVLDRGVFTAFAGHAAGALGLGELAFGTKATTLDQHLIYNTGTGALFYDVDGLGGVAQVQIAALTLHPVLAAADVILL